MSENELPKNELPKECTHAGHCKITGVEYIVQCPDPEDPDEDDAVEMAAIESWEKNPDPEKPVCPVYWQCRHCDHWTDVEPEGFSEDEDSDEDSGEYEIQSEQLQAPETPYVSVPVSAANDIGLRYSKDVVVVIALDMDHEKMHGVSWGAKPEDKILAAKLADFLMVAAGADLSKKETFEDFRQVDLAKSRHQVERIVNNIRYAETHLARAERGEVGAIEMARKLLQEAISFESGEQ